MSGGPLTDEQTERSYAYARRIARRTAKNFYYTFLLLPPERRRSLHVVYTYSRRLDDAVDAIEEKGQSPEQAGADLEFLRSLLSANPPDDPLLPALKDTIARFRIPLTFFEELIEGMYMDLRKQRYSTFDELYLYCYRAASCVGLVCVEIFGHDGNGVAGPAEELGIAMQLTNILRDVSEDLERGRIYLPFEDLARFGYSEEDLARGVVDGRFRDLMAFEVARARDYFERAQSLFPHIRPESRSCPVLLKRFYSRILDRIERQGYDVLSRRPSLPLRTKLGLAAGAWVGKMLGRGLTSSP